MLERKPILFLHNFKTGGMFIKKRYGKQIFNQSDMTGTKPSMLHADVRYYINTHGKSYFKGMKTFAFVRNPWDRMVSLYFFFQNSQRKPNPVREFPYETFDDFVEAVFRKRGTYSFFKRPSVAYTHYNGKQFVDFIGKYENFAKYVKLADVKFKLQPEIELSEIVNSSSHKHYSEYYTNPKTYDLVAKGCEIDCETFGYEFTRN